MANKKINQLVLKTTIQSTDLFPLGDPTTGQLFKKTIAELQAAIGGAVISVNGLVGTVVLDTDDIQELGGATNRYFTDARARGAISLTVSGNSGASTYNNSTGVLNVPTYTLAGLGGITATFLSGASGIAYNSSTGVITYTGTVYTDASIRVLLSAGNGISYNSSTGAITNSAPDQVVSIAGGTGITVTGSYPSFTVAYSGTVYTDASVRGLFSGTAPITYNSSTGAIGITQASGSTDGFLSSTDWTTFNNKQNAITLTTTGTSGAATFSGGTLNIPQYQAVLTNPVTGTGTTNFVTKWTSSSAIGNSQIFDNGTNVGIGTSSPAILLSILSSTASSSTLDAIFNITNDVNSNFRIFVTGSAASDKRTAIGSTTGTALAFITNNTERMRITSEGVATFTSGVISNAYLVAKGTRLSDAPDAAGVYLGTAGSGAGTFASIEMVAGTSGCSEIDFTSPSVDKKGRIKYDNSSNYMSFTTNNTESMRITSSGSLLVGSGLIYGRTTISTGLSKTSNTFSDLASALHLSTSESDTPFGIKFFIIGNSTSSLRTVDIQTGTHGIANEGNICLQASGGKVGIGTTTPDAPLNVSLPGSNTGVPIKWGNINAGNYGGLGFNDGGMFLGFAGNNHLQAHFTGNILIGTTTDNGEKLFVSGSIRATGSITANSDARLKKNIERIENALEKVGQISGYTYNTIYDEDRHAGVIAQEIDKVLPEIVNKGNDGLMGVEYGNISALLIEAIKEQKVLIESLQAKVEALRK